ncbi:ankyrin repeat-containing protein BDA1-like [Vigna unguiculata]|uniref:Ankyrin n=1 Tax=Vigna unguiculata TaxID=3917 RepID=A0A4D6N8P8_VIGUN|nr:ankyrin repeat-containing protein BDA1-like [Vigna unguiculata]QCE08515.1 ankyrin [Vigna unguiculata]
MDGRLAEAAATGNVDELERLMREEMLLLDGVSLHGAQTPLHIASMCGHVSFVQKMLELKNQFAYELNQDGFSPMHLASANGHLQVVLELVKVDHQLCDIEGREGSLPLHCASVKGRIDVMKALLSAAPLTVQSKTVRGETPLHIAVKNNHFDAVKLVVEHAKGLKMERAVLNDKDNQANTVLHIAASRKQYQIVDLLLVEDDVAKEVMVVNPVNERGMTPLDVLTLFQSEVGDLEIYRSLVKAGAKSGKDIENEGGRIGQAVAPLEIEIVHGNEVPPTNCTNEESSNLPTRTGYNWLGEEELELFEYKPNRDSTNDVRNILLTIAALMLTATYQAVLSPPGGLWQEDKDGNTAGKSIVSTKSKLAFLFFILGNSVGYYTSFYMIMWLTSGFPLQYPLQLLLFFMSFNYTVSMLFLVSGDNIYYMLAWLAISFGWFAPFVLPKLLRRLRFLLQN